MIFIFFFLNLVIMDVDANAFRGTFMIHDEHKRSSLILDKLARAAVSSTRCVPNNNVFISRGLECRARFGDSLWSRIDEPVNARPRSPLSRNIAPRGIREGETGRSDFSAIPDSTPDDVGGLGIVPASDGHSIFRDAASRTIRSYKYSNLFKFSIVQCCIS